MNRKSLVLLTLLSVLYACSYFQRVAIPGTVFDDIQNSLHLSAEQVLLLGSLYLIPYSLMQIFMGAVADLWSGARVSFIGGIVLTIGSILFPLSDSLPVIYLSRLLIGLGGSAMYLCMVQEAASRAPSERFVSYLATFTMIGYMGGIFATTPFRMVVDWTSWRIALFLVGMGTLATMMGLWRVLPKAKTPPPAIMKALVGNLIQVFANKKAYYPAFCGSMIWCCFFLLQTAIGVKFLVDLCGISAQKASLCPLFMMIGNIIAMHLFGVLCRKISRRRPILCVTSMVSLSGSLLLIFGAATGAGVWLFFFACMLLSLAAGGLMVVVEYMKDLNPPERAGAAIGFYNTFAYLIVAGGTLIAGKMMDVYLAQAKVLADRIIYPPQSYLLIFSVMAVMGFLAVFVSFFAPETYGRNTTSARRTAE